MAIEEAPNEEDEDDDKTTPEKTESPDKKQTVVEGEDRQEFSLDSNEIVSN